MFIDSDHSVEHTKIELAALWPLTRPRSVFLFHDLPEWQTPAAREAVPIRTYLLNKCKDANWQGGIVPTCEQLDCLAAFGAGYPPQCNPHLGIFIRQ